MIADNADWLQNQGKLNDLLKGVLVITLRWPIKSRANRVFVALVMLAGIWYGYHLYAQHEQAERDTVYSSVLERYRHDLHVGVTRLEVERFLNRNQTPYGYVHMAGSGNTSSYKIRIGSDPGDALVCREWAVYIAFDFDDPSQRKGEAIGDFSGEPDDILKEIRIFKWCR